MSYDYNASSYPVQSATWDNSSQAGSVYSPTAYNQMWPATPTGHVALASPNASLYSPYNTAPYAAASGYIYAYPNGQYSGASGYYGTTQQAYGQVEGSKQKTTKTNGTKSASSAASYSNNSHHAVSYGAYGGQTQTNTQLHDYDTLLSYYGYPKPNQGGGGYRGHSSYATKPKGREATNASGKSTANPSGTSTVNQSGTSTGAVDSNLTQQFAGKCKVASPDAKIRTANVSSSWSEPHDGTGGKGNSHVKPESDVYVTQSTTNDYAGSNYDYYGGKGEPAKSWPSAEPTTQNRYDSSSALGSYSHSTPDTSSSYNSSRAPGSSVQSVSGTYNSSSSYALATQETSNSFNSSQGGYGNSTPGTPLKTHSHSTQQSVSPYTSSSTQSTYTSSKPQATAYSSSAQSSYSHSSQHGSYSYSSAGAPGSYAQQSASSANTSNSYSCSTSSNSGYGYSSQQAVGSYGTGSSYSAYGEKTADTYDHSNVNNNNSNVAGDKAGSAWDKTTVTRSESYNANKNATEGIASGGACSGADQSYTEQTATSYQNKEYANSSEKGSKTQYGFQKQGFEEQSGEDAEAVNTVKEETGVADHGEYAVPAEETVTVPVNSEPMIPVMDEEPITREGREQMFPVSSGLYHKATSDTRRGRPFNREEDLGNYYSDGANFYTMSAQYGQPTFSTGRQAWARKDQFTRAAPVTGGFGMKMLRRMGWKPGDGLGKERHGEYEPLEIKVKIDRKGLVSEEELTAKGKIKRPVPELNIKIDPKKTKNVPVAPKVLSAEEEAKLREMVAHRHPCMALNELCGKKQWPLPAFKIIFKNYGVCSASVNVNGTTFEATHPNKKLAKAEVSRVALQQLGYAPMDLNCCFNKKTFL